MKGRSGFVSNSSTASFVLLGFDATGIDLDREDMEENEDFSVLWGSEDGCPEGVEQVIGKYVFRCSSDSWAEADVTEIGPLMMEVIRIRERFKSSARINLWSGMQSC